MMLYAIAVSFNLHNFSGDHFAATGNLVHFERLIQIDPVLIILTIAGSNSCSADLNSKVALDR